MRTRNFKRFAFFHGQRIHVGLVVWVDGLGGRGRAGRGRGSVHGVNKYRIP